MSKVELDSLTKQSMNKISVKKRNGRLEPLNLDKINKCAERACVGLEGVSASEIVLDASIQLYNKVTTIEIDKALILSARSKIEKEPNYSFAAARILANSIYKEVFDEGVDCDSFELQYRKAFIVNLKKLVKAERISPKLLSFDLKRLADAIIVENDNKFKYLGLQTLYDRYFIHIDGRRMESLQAFWMRVAMGLSVNESDKEEAAIEAYRVMSNFLYTPSTPTLFNAGTLHPQLSSCYLSTLEDSIDGIFGTIHGQARLSKYAGGLGVDWTPIRGTESYIKGTNGKSNGLIPWLKIFNDMLVAVNQCFAPDTRIFTADGPKRIADITTNDLVLTSNGEYRKVNETMEYHQCDPMVRINVKHSILPIDVTAGHPFYVLRGIKKETTNQRTYKSIANDKHHMEWIEARHLQSGDYVAQPVPQDVIFDKNITENDAYLYGLMLGDGHFSGDGYEAGISLHLIDDLAIQEWVKNYLDKQDIHYWTTVRDNYIKIEWSANKLSAITAVDLYGENHEKRVSRRFRHLPIGFATQIIKGLIDSDGWTSRGTEIAFTNTSLTLVEDLRYQLLRIGIPSAANKRKREYDHEIIRHDGSISLIKGVTISYDLRIPAVEHLAKIFGVKAIKKHNWLRVGNLILTRIKSVSKIDPCEKVYDLKVEGMEEYATTAGLAHNGGKRKGAGCSYLETWHTDIESFLELRKNTGDERLRCHDMHTANWIPDLFMKRVQQDGDWYLFSPSDTPDLHDLFGAKFEEKYKEYCEKADAGEIKNYRVIKAKDLWKKMLRALIETGHPWITFKDPSNIRYTDQHIGVVHNSNLCTEILRHTIANKYKDGLPIEIGETAVCLSEGTPILTSSGYQPIEFCNNAQVLVPYTSDKDWTPAERFEKATLIDNGDQEVFRVSTASGSDIEATRNHRFLVQRKLGQRRPGRPKDTLPTFEWVELKNLLIGDKIVSPATSIIDDFKVSTEGQDEDYLTAGWMLGDDWQTNSAYGVCFGSPEDAIAETIVVKTLSRWHAELPVMAGASHDFVPAIRTDRNGVRSWATEKRSVIKHVNDRFGFKISTGPHKRISSAIKSSTPEQQAAFLSGLYSADGCVMLQRGTSMIITLTTASRRLAQDVQTMLRNFGIHSRLRSFFPKRREGRSQTILDLRGRENCTAFLEHIGFALHPRKQHDAFRYLRVINNRRYLTSGYRHSEVVSITAVGAKRVYDLALPNGHHFVANGLIVHNCNLGSLNLIEILRQAISLCKDCRDTTLTTTLTEFYSMIRRTTKVAIKMLNNVIDENFYPTEEAKNANMNNRPVGLGIMGFHDVLHELKLTYESDVALELSSDIQEHISYEAILTSASIAEKDGPYPNYKGSLWDQGKLPIDTYNDMMSARAGDKWVEKKGKLNWTPVREIVKKHGVRNSNTMAIAPTATISYVNGCSQSIEPDYSVLYVYSTLSGDFTMISEYFVRRAKELGIWCPELADAIKQVDGDITALSLPEPLKEEFKSCFNINQQKLIDCAAARQIWIDMGQSLNIYSANMSLKYLNDIYFHAWESGLKTTYYLRSQSASKIEKATVDAPKAASIPKQALACSLEAAKSGEVCEACQ